MKSTHATTGGNQKDAEMKNENTDDKANEKTNEMKEQYNRRHPYEVHPEATAALVFCFLF